MCLWSVSIILLNTPIRGCYRSVKMFSGSTARRMCGMIRSLLKSTKLKSNVTVSFQNYCTVVLYNVAWMYQYFGQIYSTNRICLMLWTVIMIFNLNGVVGSCTCISILIQVICYSFVTKLEVFTEMRSFVHVWCNK